MSKMTKLWLFFAVPGTLLAGFLGEVIPYSGSGTIPYVWYLWGFILVSVSGFFTFVKGWR